MKVGCEMGCVRASINVIGNEEWGLEKGRGRNHSGDFCFVAHVVKAKIGGE